LVASGRIQPVFAPLAGSPYACEERAEAREHSELETIERETEEEVAAEPNEIQQGELESGGYEREEEA
jgi:hypothetical protein